MLEERLNYLSILSVENNIAKSLPYDEVIKRYAVKCVEKSYYRGISGSSLMKIVYIFLDFVMFVVSVCFLKFVICCDFFSHST